MSALLAQREGSEAYWEWRYSRNDRYGSCPSLQEAFEAGLRARTRAPSTIYATIRESARARGYQAGFAAGLREGQESGHAAGYAEGYQVGRLTRLEQDPVAMLEELGLSHIRFSVRETQVLWALAQGGDTGLSARTIEQAVWRSECSENATRTLINRIRAKLLRHKPLTHCVGSVAANGYRLHVIAGTTPCIEVPYARGGHVYVPLCRRGNGVAPSGAGVTG